MTPRRPTDDVLCNAQWVLARARERRSLKFISARNELPRSMTLLRQKALASGSRAMVYQCQFRKHTYERASRSRSRTLSTMFNDEKGIWKILERRDARLSLMRRAMSNEKKNYVLAGRLVTVIIRDRCLTAQCTQNNINSTEGNRLLNLFFFLLVIFNTYHEA